MRKLHERLRLAKTVLAGHSLKKEPLGNAEPSAFEGILRYVIAEKGQKLWRCCE